MLTSDDNGIHKAIRPHNYEQITPQAKVSYLLSQGFKPLAASAIATGALVDRLATIELAKSLKLLVDK